MDAKEAEERYHRADALFREGKPREAMEILTRLDRQFPNTRRILFPMALCLERMGFPAEAEQICDRLISQFRFEKAVEIKARILAARNAPAAAQGAAASSAVGPQPVDVPDTPNIPGIDLGLGNELAGPATTSVPDVSIETAGADINWKKYALIGGAVVAVLLVVVLPLAVGFAKGGWQQPQQAAAPVETAPERAGQEIASTEDWDQSGPWEPSGGSVFKTVAIQAGLDYLTMCIAAFIAAYFFNRNFFDTDVLFDSILKTAITSGIICAVYWADFILFGVFLPPWGLVDAIFALGWWIFFTVKLFDLGAVGFIALCMMKIMLNIGIGIVAATVLGFHMIPQAIEMLLGFLGFVQFLTFS